MCIVSLFRRAWVEEERLTFPLVPLPLQMTESGGATPFWKNHWMWTGFVVAGLAESVNYLAFRYPSDGRSRRPGVPRRLPRMSLERIISTRAI